MLEKTETAPEDWMLCVRKLLVRRVLVRRQGGVPAPPPLKFSGEGASLPRHSAKLWGSGTRTPAASGQGFRELIVRAASVSYRKLLWAGLVSVSVV